MNMPGLNTLSSLPKGDDNKIANSDDSQEESSHLFKVKRYSSYPVEIVRGMFVGEPLENGINNINTVVGEETVDGSRFSKYSISLRSASGSKYRPHFSVEMGQEERVHRRTPQEENH
ncbi:hypothetical protein Tco_0014891 [Tanacetum coccineum]